MRGAKHPIPGKQQLVSQKIAILRVFNFYNFYFGVTVNSVGTTEFVVKNYPY